MFDGADDLMLCPDLDAQWRRVGRRFAIGALAAIGVLIWATVSFAQSGALISCSQTVGAASAPVTFPASGGTGPSSAAVYLEICNAHATNTLGVNATGATAAIGSAGTLTLNPGGCVWFNSPPIPASVSVIGSAGSTTTACWYK